MSQAAVPEKSPASPSLALPRSILGYDVGLVLLTFVMVAFGLVMVYSASWDVSWRLYGDSAAIFRRQLMNLAVALMLLVTAARMPLQWLHRVAVPLMALTLLMLVTVLLIGAGGGPRRAILGASVQPSELAKLAMIVYLAVWMESKGEKLVEWGYGLGPLVVMLGIISGLILLQPDLSAALTIGMVAFMMFYLAGARWEQILSILVGSAAVGYLLVRVTNTGKERWDYFLNGLVDVEQASYHVQRSLQAFYAGGIFGRGLGASREKFGLLPAPHTDSIFAIIGEELGLIGASLVLLLFTLFIWRGFRLAMRQSDRLALLLGGGVTFWIAIEALINMAVLLGLLPFAGNALPFFSYGGSNLVTTLAGVGLLLNISRNRIGRPVERTYVATLGGGRRDRRRRVSRVSRRRRAPRGR
jgi:cell division protein FtsW